jgi:catechol 2,3-dioxygenase-like lactoylglutathione lyase family enzyme
VTAVPAYVGVVVADLERSTQWYVTTLGCMIEERSSRWVCLGFPNGTVIELFAGDPSCPSLTHPSFGLDSATPVIPGYAVDEPMLASNGLRIARWLPDWVVVVLPDALRIVLHRREVRSGRGLVAFRFASPDAAAQRGLLAALGSADLVDDHPTHGVVPVVLADYCGLVNDPDGNLVELITRRHETPSRRDC